MDTSHGGLCPFCQNGKKDKLINRSTLRHKETTSILSRRKKKSKGFSVQGQSAGECQCCVIVTQGDHLNVFTPSDLNASFKGILFHTGSY
ncbi:hypothetical protein EYF80_028471 [Liparis tanakae]|uniref:Uncharacterized protein n=1 Tax=Liparis tanakae TaxID=230148 RepID=A0A4Z2H5W4_9TELE|nr:hypothetical protein EYF80_028471 [Liparis tanakae]